MEKEREEQSQNDPEAMKTLTRVQVSILLYSTFKYLSCFYEDVSIDTDKAMVTFCSFKTEHRISSRSEENRG